jgi:hypothetical protein
MKLPNSKRAVIAPDKLVQCLLNTEHKRGGHKAWLLRDFGYDAALWQQLQAVRPLLDGNNLCVYYKLYSKTERGPRVRCYRADKKTNVESSHRNWQGLTGGDQSCGQSCTCYAKARRRLGGEKEWRRETHASLPEQARRCSVCPIGW